MSQKSSVPQAVSFVSQVLKRDNVRERWRFSLKINADRDSPKFRDEGVAGSNPATPTRPPPWSLISRKYLQHLANQQRAAYTTAYTSGCCEWSRCVRTAEETSAHGSGFLTMCERNTGGSTDSASRPSSLPQLARARQKLSGYSMSGRRKSRSALQAFGLHSVAKGST